MLNDPSRKLLRILQNFSSLNGRPPSIQELVRKTGRTTGQVKMTLRVLAVEGYIEWQPNRHNELKVIQGWEIKHRWPQK